MSINNPKTNEKDYIVKGNDHNIRYTLLKMILPITLIITLIFLNFSQKAFSLTAPLANSNYTIPNPILELKKLQRSRCTDAPIVELCSKSRKLFEAMADSMNAFYDTENHVLGHTSFSKNVYSRQAYVANGYIGARISTLGQGFSYDEINTHSPNVTDDVLLNGWPLFNRRHTGAFAAGFYSLQERLPDTNFPELYENGYDSVISTIPYWANLDLILTKDGEEYRFNPQTIDDDDITNYHQNLSMLNGLVSTKLIWLEEVEIIIDVYAHRVETWLGIMDVRLKALNDNLTITVESSLDFATSQRAQLVDLGFGKHDGIYMVVSPDNVRYSSAAVISELKLQSENSTTQKSITGDAVFEKADIQLIKGEVYQIHKYTSISSSEKAKPGYNDPDPKDESENQFKIAQTNLDFTLATTQHSDLIESHKETWRGYFKHTDIQIPSEPLLTLTARASLYHLLANSDPTSRGLTSAFSTTGLSSDSYGGMVFWDTDVWIIPGLVPFYKDNAKAISDYRVYTHDQARLNAEQYGYTGASYPWTSGRFGNCTSTGPCVDYEYHINVDVALSSFLLYLAGEDDEYLSCTTWPLMRDASDFLSQYTQFDSKLSKFTTKNLTDPDEYANHIDNGAFTNSGIDSLLKATLLVANHLEEPINPRWVNVQGNIHIPESESGITLEYTGMNASVSIKQADVILLTFPLDNVVNEEKSRNDLFYYSLKQADIGPAMTFPIFTVAASRLLDYGCSSQSYLRKSIVPYIRAPFAQFSEQADDNILTNGGTHPAFPFLTAHGGYLQAIVYGILGLKYSVRVNEETGKLERYMKFDPIKQLTLPGGVLAKGIYYMNQRLDVMVNDDEGVIFNHGTKSINVEVQPRNPKSGNYTIEPNSKFSVPVYEPHQNIFGSYSECNPIVNLTAGAPGEVALSAIDGNNYTYWQPLFRSTPGRLLIDLGTKRQIDQGLAIWGSRPAKYLSLYAYDHENDITDRIFEDILLNFNEEEFEKILDRLPIEISEPFDIKYLTEVNLFPNNETVFEIDRKDVITRYILIEIEEALDDDDIEQGATLNEFALF